MSWRRPLPPIDRRRLQFFAKAIGATDPIYSDVAVPQAAGYPDIPAPPTFLFAAELDSGVLDQMLADLDIPIGKLLHGEQNFIYRRPVFAGESVTVQSVDVADDFWSFRQDLHLRLYRFAGGYLGWSVAGVASVGLLPVFRLIFTQRESK